VIYDTVVEFDHSINTAVKRLRDALGESADKPRYIETLARRGYRFTGKVETSNQPPSAAPLVIVPRDDNRPRLPLQRLRILLATMILLALAGTWYYRRGAPARWAREVALPEVTRLVQRGESSRRFPVPLPSAADPSTGPGAEQNPA
jgi:Transcriptional regulatory protein, C terminal